MALLLADQAAVVDRIVDLFVSTDRRDWAAVERCLADTVLFDMTSLSGGTPSRVPAAQIAAGWAQGLAPLQAVHHQAGNFRVEVTGDQATAFCYAIAFHYRRVASGRNTRTFVGSYDFHLAWDDATGWRIDLFRFHCAFVDGNQQLDSEPAEAS